MIRVLVADDHLAVREGLRALLANEREITIVGEADDGSTALALARSLRPDLIVLDDSMPGQGSLDVARKILAELPDTAVVFLARDPALRDLALAAGATAFVSKDAPSEELLRALRASSAAVTARQQLSALRPEGRRVVELLLGSRVMSGEQVQEALSNRAAGESLATTVVRLGLVGQPELADILARATDTPFVSLAPYPEISAPIDPTESRLSSPRLVDPVEREAARSLPLDIARGLGVVVTAADRGHGVVAMADPLDEAAFAEAQRHSGLRLTRVTATSDDIKDTLERVWNGGGSREVIWTGNLLSKVYASLVLGVIVVAGIGGFGVLFRDALAPRFAFSLFALFCGLFFFLYALKYYVTIASVILITLFGDPAKFQGRHANGHTNGNGLKADGHTNGNGHGNGQHKEGYRTLRGEKLSEAGAVVVTDPWQKMGEIRLPADRQPFVSIHLALYNEARVVDRLLEACTSFDYENYEVIVADDSTDETVEKLKKWKEHPRVRVIHRSSRKGFKGGALQEALRRMNPHTEYVMVFDADFVPPADAIWHFLDYFGRLSKPKNGNGNGHKNGPGAPQNGDRLAVVQGYQWHMLNASENWVTKGVRAEFSGSYVLERAGQELFGAMKMISGSVYMIRADVLRKLGWSTSITEDWELTIRLYLAGYKVLYTPYIQAPAECVSEVRRLIKQRMRWAEGHTYNVRKYFWPILRSPNLTFQEKLEFVYYAPYYLQSVLFTVATLAWILGVLVLGQKLPMWGEIFGWSLVVSNALALPLMNLTGVLLEGSLKRDALGLLSFIGLSWILVPFQAYASLKALFEKKEGGWVRTPKSGRVTETLERFHLARLMPWELPKRKRGQGKAKGGAGRAAAAVVVLTAAGILTLGALSIRAAATSGLTSETDFAVPALLGTMVPLLVLALGWLRLRRRVTAIVLAFTLGLGTNVVFLAHAVPAAAVTDNSSVFTFEAVPPATAFASPNQNMKQNYTPTPAASAACTGISYRSGASGSATSATSLVLSVPAGVRNGDVMVAAVGVGSGTVVAPSGWTAGPSITAKHGTWYRVAASEPASYTWTVASAANWAGVVDAFVGVDGTTPLDVAGSGNSGISTTVTWTSITSVTSQAWSIAISFENNNVDGIPAPNAYTARSAQGGAAFVRSSTRVIVPAGAIAPTAPDTAGFSNWAAYSLVLRPASPSAGSNWTCTYSSDTFSTGQSMSAGNATADLYLDNRVSTTAFRNPAGSGSSTSACSPFKPTGVANGDVLVAACALRGGSGTTITPPDGTWNLVRRVDNGTTVSVVTYWHVVTDAASEPTSYQFAIAPAEKNVGVILAYSGVDNATPLDAHNGQATASGLSHASPSVTTSFANDRLITFHALARTNSCASQWTPPTGMTERQDFGTCTGGNASNVTLEGNDLLLAEAGPTNTQTAMSSESALGATQTLALRPAARTCTLAVSLLKVLAAGGTTTVGTTTVQVPGPGDPTLVSKQFATSAVTFATGDQLQLDVVAPNDSANCNVTLHYDSASRLSKLTVATIVPEGIAGLLLVAPALPFAARWWNRRRP